MKLDDFITRTKDLINQGNEVLKTTRTNEWGDYVDSGKYLGFRAGCLSFLCNLFDKEHPYYQEFDKSVSDANPSRVEQGLGVLFAVKSELEGGWLTTAKGLVSAEIFSDFLEMANHLLDEGYKDPAAVMAGSVLEEHIRNLCSKNGINTHIEKDGKVVPKKAAILNADLAKSSITSKLDEKAINAWLDLRNKAAHGKYGEYTKEQVQLLIQSVVDFMLRVPA